MLKLNGRTIEFGVFPNGESFADIDKMKVGPIDKVNRILFKFESDKDIFNLICLKDFVDTNWPHIPCHLIMPYVPYSRMDRQEEIRLFTLKTFAKLIDSMNFASVEVWEPHSEVTPALIDRVAVVNKSAELALLAMRDELGLVGDCWFTESYSYTDGSGAYGHCLEGLLYKAKKSNIFLVYPDAGAEKRYRKQIKYPNVLTCSKTRDFNSGRISSINLHGYEDAQNCEVAIIVDDLCSRGGTFIGTAAELRKHLPNLKRVILCITHCENSIFDGSVLTGTEINKVYTTNSILSKSHEKIEIVE